MKLLLFLLLLLPSICSAADFNDVEVIRVYDGDTITVNIFDAPAIFGKHLGIRISGIDTPEIKGKCKQEKDLAMQARDYVKTFLGERGNVIDLMGCSRGKYFRLVCSIEDLSERLIDKGLAVPYFGETKTKEWCEQ